jgi:mannose-6-phosphate isomerase-like protein (cupin superfamily)
MAGAGFAALPFQLLAKQLTKKRIDKAVVIENGKDRFDKPLALFEGDTFYCKVSGKDTEGDIYVFESTRIKEGGPDYHFHYEQDEWWYVLQGEFDFKVGDKLFHARQGDSVFGPRMVPHTFAKVGPGEARLLMFFQPAGKMEAFFKAASEGVLKKLSADEKKQFKKIMALNL